MRVSVNIPVSSLQVSSKITDEGLVGVVRLESKSFTPAAMARLLNLAKQHAMIECELFSAQAQFDLEILEIRDIPADTVVNGEVVVVQDEEVPEPEADADLYEPLPVERQLVVAGVAEDGED